MSVYIYRCVHIYLLMCMGKFGDTDGEKGPETIIGPGIYMYVCVCVYVCKDLYVYMSSELMVCMMKCLVIPILKKDPRLLLVQVFTCIFRLNYYHHYFHHCHHTIINISTLTNTCICSNTYINTYRYAGAI
jgi:hypothetical protein